MVRIGGVVLCPAAEDSRIENDMVSRDPMRFLGGGRWPGLEVGMAERVGFEPTVPCGTPDFESGTIGHSVTSP